MSGNLDQAELSRRLLPSPQDWLQADAGCVAQVSNLLYPRLPVCGTRYAKLACESQRAARGREGSGLEIRDTAGWKPALRFGGRTVLYPGVGAVSQFPGPGLKRPSFRHQRRGWPEAPWPAANRGSTSRAGCWMLLPYGWPVLSTSSPHRHLSTTSRSWRVSFTNMDSARSFSVLMARNLHPSSAGRLP